MPETDEEQIYISFYESQYHNPGSRFPAPPFPAPRLCGGDSSAAITLLVHRVESRLARTLLVGVLGPMAQPHRWVSSHVLPRASRFGEGCSAQMLGQGAWTELRPQRGGGGHLSPDRPHPRLV